MRVERKARVAQTLLLLLALWPALHYGVIAYTAIDPWRLYGFAMYCQPSTDILVSFFDVQGDEERVIPIDVLGAEVERELITYRSRHKTYGKLAPDGVADALLAQAPEVKQLRVRVRTLKLDALEARFTYRPKDYFYP